MKDIKYHSYKFCRDVGVATYYRIATTDYG